MKRGLVAVGVAALLLLTGCTSTVTSETVTVTPGASGTFSDGDTTVEVQPLTAEAPTSAPQEAPDDAAFVAAVRESLRPENVIPNVTDEQLVQAGQKACEMEAAGIAAEDISVIAGEERGRSGYYLDSFTVYKAAAAHLC